MNTVNLLGRVDVINCSADAFIKHVLLLLKKGKKNSLFYINAFGLEKLFQNEQYYQALLWADFVYADGWGAVFASYFSQKKIEERINLADFYQEIFSYFDQKSYKIFFLGSEKQVLQAIIQQVKNQYPNIKIVGTVPGFFHHSRSKEIIALLKQRQPHLVLIGMGMPRQELWVRAYWESLPSALYWTVGGFFYYLGGLRKRAPTWMLQRHLEWLFRLYQEPLRLYKRYTWLNVKFVFYVLRYGFWRMILKTKK